MTEGRQEDVGFGVATRERCVTAAAWKPMRHRGIIRTCAWPKIEAARQSWLGQIRDQTQQGLACEGVWMLRGAAVVVGESRKEQAVTVAVVFVKTSNVRQADPGKLRDRRNG